MALDHTPVKELLEAAHKAVTEAKLPQGLQATAFGKAIDLLAAQTGVPVAAPGSASLAGSATGVAGSSPSAPASGAPKTLAAVAAKLKVSNDAVSEVFHLEGEDVALSIGTSKLSDHHNKAVEEVALLVTSARQAGGWDAEWTAVSEIRTVADSFGKVDTNFATYVKRMDDEFSFSGSGPSRKVKLKRKGYELAAELVKKIAGEE
jgi:di/tripeptidase